MTYLGILLAAFTVIILIYAALTILRERYPKNTGTPSMKPVMPYLVPEGIEELVSERPAFSGDPFENFVVDNFDRRYFHFRAARNNRNVRYTSISDDPDLVLEYRHRDTNISFAVECKWRPGYLDNAVHWANTTKILNYYAYQNEENIPVFVVMGIGGTPNLPKELYVIPLNRIPRFMHYLTDHFLRSYAKQPGSSFYFDVKSMQLH